MVKLTKSTNIPATLQSVVVAQEMANLEEIVASGNKPKHKDFKSDLYGASDVREQLMADQFDKCVFCECTLLSQNGGEVDHYRPKTACRQDKSSRNMQRPAYYRLAYAWDNLSACCHACNRRKSTFFPLRNSASRFNLDAEEPLIINPYNEDPSLHIEFCRAKLYSKVDDTNNEDKKGCVTP